MILKPLKAAKYGISRCQPVYYLWIKMRCLLIHRLSTLSCQGSQQVDEILVDAFLRFAQRCNTATGV